MIDLTYIVGNKFLNLGLFLRFLFNLKFHLHKEFICTFQRSKSLQF